MTEETFLKKVSYAIDRYNGKLTVFYEKTPLKTILLHKNMDYNEENKKLSIEIALKSNKAKQLIK